MLIKTHVPRADSPYKSGAGVTSDTKTDPLGYRSLAQQITEYTVRGVALDAYRMGAFDSDSLPPGREPQIDPTRAYGFDMADASSLIEDTRAHLRNLYYQRTVEERQRLRLQKATEYHEYLEMLNRLKSPPPSYSPQSGVAGAPQGAGASAQKSG